MAITGERHVGTFEGHQIELVFNNWNKTLALIIDGTTVAQESRLLPHNITLEAQFEHEQVTHTVVARSEVKKILGLPLREDAGGIEVDGKSLALDKVK